MEGDESLTEAEEVLLVVQGEFVDEESKKQERSTKEEKQLDSGADEVDGVEKLQEIDTVEGEIVDLVEGEIIEDEIEEKEEVKE